MIELAPLTFRPYLKSVIWGGNKICSYKGMGHSGRCIGESWEISEVPGHESIVECGKYKEMSLSDLIARYPRELLGEKVLDRYGRRFPLLVKLIDAADNLSVQVHPDDKLAKKRHNSLGKTEMWYIINCDEDAKIYAGLNTELTPENYTRRVAEGTFADTLAVHRSDPGDVFFLPAGRVHAIGAGNLLAEIQESSDVTYRIHDYDRRDAQGHTRELHTDLAKDAIDYTVYPEYKSPRPSDADKETQLAECEHFSVRRLLVDGTEKMTLDTGSFTVVMCVGGAVRLSYPAGEMLLTQGHTCLIPAALPTLTLTGSATLLTVMTGAHE